MDEVREAYWRRKLRRLRLGAEPVADQVARQGRATVALTGIAAAVAMIFLAIFAAFGRPGVGAIVLGLLLAPVVALAWFDFVVLKARVLAYSREVSAEGKTDVPAG